MTGSDDSVCHIYLGRGWNGYSCRIVSVVNLDGSRHWLRGVSSSPYPYNFTPLLCVATKLKA